MMSQVPAAVTFGTSGNLAMFWGFVRVMLIYVGPFLFIWIALELVGWVTHIVRGTYGVDNDKDDRIRRADYERERRDRID